MQQRNAATLEAPNRVIAEAKNSGLPKAENNRTGMVWANNPQTVRYNHRANIVVNLRIDNGKTRMQLTAPISGTISPKKAPKFMFTANSNRYKAYRRINFRYFLDMGFPRAINSRHNISYYRVQFSLLQPCLEWLVFILINHLYT